MINLNTTGIFKGKPPLVIPEKIMTVVGVTNIRALVASDVDLYSRTYKGVFPDRVFDEHISQNQIILTFKDDSGTLHYYPDVYIHSTERVDVVEYVEKTLIINLGSHKLIKTFHGATQRIINTIIEHEGLTATAKLVNSSKPRSVKNDTHLEILEERRNNKASVQDPYMTLIERDKYISVLEARNANLIQFFVEYLDQCTTSSICCGDINDPVVDPEVIIPEKDATDAYLDGCEPADDAPGADEYYIQTSR